MEAHPFSLKSPQDIQALPAKTFSSALHFCAIFEQIFSCALSSSSTVSKGAFPFPVVNSLLRQPGIFNKQQLERNVSRIFSLSTYQSSCRKII